MESRLTPSEKIKILEIAIQTAGTGADYKEIYKDIIKLIEGKHE